MMRVSVAKFNFLTAPFAILLVVILVAVVILVVFAIRRPTNHKDE